MMRWNFENLKPKKIVFEKNEDNKTYHIQYIGLELVNVNGVSIIDIDIPKADIVMKNIDVKTEGLCCYENHVGVGIPVIEEIYKDSNENYLIMKDVTDNA